MNRSSKALFLRTDWQFLGVVAVGFIVLKIRHLQLPYFWDEAWSYFPAIQVMAEQGPSLLPGSIDPVLYRGHPTLFYFLAASWRRIVGTDILAMRLLPMLLSLALLVVLFRLGKRHFGRRAAAMSVVLFGIQSVFLAQSSFLLPEVMLALLTLLSIDAYFSGKKWAVGLWLSLLLLTKESGMVLWLAFAIWDLGDVVAKRQFFKIKLLLGKLWPLLLSAIPVGLFFLLQKIRLGWFFFPEHVGLVVLDAWEVLGKLKGILAYLFIDMGRNILTLFGGISLIVVANKKIAVADAPLRLLYFIGLFTLLYVLFSATNFYTPRYMLSVMPLTIMAFVFLMEKAVSSFDYSRFPLIARYFQHAIFTVVIANNLAFTFLMSRGNDHNLGFADVVKSHQEMVAFLEQKQAQDLPIATGFLTRTNLANVGLGYLAEGKPFEKLTGEVGKGTAFATMTSVENDANFLESIKRHRGELLKRFEFGKAWAEVYVFE